jgi:hypothetical protein
MALNPTGLNFPTNPTGLHLSAGPGMLIGTLPHYYFNGFALNLSPADMSMTVTLDGAPQMRLSMSFTTAKTLSAFLVDMVAKLEGVTRHNIMKTDEVEAGLRALEEQRLPGSDVK